MHLFVGTGQHPLNVSGIHKRRPRRFLARDTPEEEHGVSVGTNYHELVHTVGDDASVRKHLSQRYDRKSYSIQRWYAYTPHVLLNVGEVTNLV